MRKIYMLSQSDGKESVLDFINRTHPKIKKKFIFVLGLISDENNNLCEPYVKHFAIEKYKMLYELRLRISGEMVRIIYYKAKNDIVLIHAFYKRNKKDTEKALDYSLKLLKSLDESKIEINNFLIGSEL